MAQAKFEGVGEVYLNGRLLSDAATLRVTVKTNDNPVKTMRGFVGFSAGAEDCEASIELPPPRDGFIVDWYGVVLKRQDIRLAWVDAGKRRQAEGRITQYETSKSIEQTSSVSLSFTGRPLLVGL